MRKASYDSHEINRYLRYLVDYLALQIKWEGDAKRCEAYAVTLSRLIAAERLLNEYGDPRPRGIRAAAIAALHCFHEFGIPRLPTFTAAQRRGLDNETRCVGISRSGSHAPLTIAVVVYSRGWCDKIVWDRKGPITLIHVPNRKCFTGLVDHVKHHFYGLNGHRARLHG